MWSGDKLPAINSEGATRPSLATEPRLAEAPAHEGESYERARHGSRDTLPGINSEGAPLPSLATEPRLAEAPALEGESCERASQGSGDKVPRSILEAAGVEPASERPVAAGLYMRSRTCWFAPGIKARRKRRALVRDESRGGIGRSDALSG